MGHLTSPRERTKRSIGLRACPDPHVELLRSVKEFDVLAEPLGVMPVLVVLVAVPVGEPDDRLSITVACRDLSAEPVGGAILVNCRRVASEPIVDDAEI